MFNNCDSRTNGEHRFYCSIRDQIRVIFDVGCRSDTEFTSFSGEVHYFDPMPEFIEALRRAPHANQKAYFNAFGLGHEEAQMYYYPRYQSFYDRINSCHVSDDSNKITLHIKKGKDYMIEHDVKEIDFLKIDTEGYELNVLKGFEDGLSSVKIIQFEYGGTFLDNHVTLREITDYLDQRGFSNFSYLTNEGPVPISDFMDHYQYCNIVCVNKNNMMRYF